MRIVRLASAAVVLGLVIGVGAASADTITITSGVLDVVIPHARLSIAGNEGFTLQSAFNIQGGIFRPWEQCTGLCAPGTALDLRGIWSGGDLPATATLKGVTYRNVGSADSNSSALILVTGTAMLPAFVGEDTAFTQAPFTFSGRFLPGDQGARDLTGFGTTSIWFTVDRSFGPGLISWRPTEVRYDFAVTPEPAPLALVATGLMLMGFVWWRRARTA